VKYSARSFFSNGEGEDIGIGLTVRLRTFRGSASPHKVTCEPSDLALMICWQLILYDGALSMAPYISRRKSLNPHLLTIISAAKIAVLMSFANLEFALVKNHRI
jgi:hypothetical protein